MACITPHFRSSVSSPEGAAEMSRVETMFYWFDINCCIRLA